MNRYQYNVFKIGFRILEDICRAYGDGYAEEYGIHGYLVCISECEDDSLTFVYSMSWKGESEDEYLEIPVEQLTLTVEKLKEAGRQKAKAAKAYAVWKKEHEAQQYEIKRAEAERQQYEALKKKYEGTDG